MLLKQCLAAWWTEDIASIYGLTIWWDRDHAFFISPRQEVSQSWQSRWGKISYLMSCKNLLIDPHFKSLVKLHYSLTHAAWILCHGLMDSILFPIPPPPPLWYMVPFMSPTIRNHLSLLFQWLFFPQKMLSKKLSVLSHPLGQMNALIRNMYELAVQILLY